MNASKAVPILKSLGNLEGYLESFAQSGPLSSLDAGNGILECDGSSIF